MNDKTAEKSALGIILKHGKDAMIEAGDILSSRDFYDANHKKIFTVLKQMDSDDSISTFDIESFQLKAKQLGYADFVNDKKNIEYVSSLGHGNQSIANLAAFAAQVRKLSIVRDLRGRHLDAAKYLESVTGSESITDIIKETEAKTLDYLVGIETNNDISHISDGMDELIERILAKDKVEQIGLNTGFTLWDEAIGGGPRKGTISVIASRAKCGKSYMAMNMAHNIAAGGVPVLYLDTELTADYQQSRLNCIISACPIYHFEYGIFKHNEQQKKAVIEASEYLKSLPIHYQSIAGMNHAEAMISIRRWITKHVGFDEHGKAKDCAIVYDYFKLTSGSGLSKESPEYILLGLMLTDLHNFAVRYSVPIIGFVQLNRDGIDRDDAGVVAGSDRILWLCSSMSLLKNKDENDIAQGSTFKHGNKKLLVAETRHGSGLESADGYVNYININASLRPGVSREVACGRMTEGITLAQLSGQITPIQGKEE